MAYRSKAKSIVAAVAARADGSMFSLNACYGTKIERRLSFVEVAEKQTRSDWIEYVRIKYALQRFGSIREAVRMGVFDIA